MTASASSYKGTEERILEEAIVEQLLYDNEEEDSPYQLPKSVEAL
jgi:hypothetical protein